MTVRSQGIFSDVSNHRNFTNDKQQVHIRSSHIEFGNYLTEWPYSSKENKIKVWKQGETQETLCSYTLKRTASSDTLSIEYKTETLTIELPHSDIINRPSDITGKLVMAIPFVISSLIIGIATNAMSVVSELVATAAAIQLGIVGTSALGFIAAIGGAAIIPGLGLLIGLLVIKGFEVYASRNNPLPEIPGTGTEIVSSTEEPQQQALIPGSNTGHSIKLCSLVQN